MYRDGICWVKDRLYSKTLTFNDVSYHLAQNEEQLQIFEGYGDFLNFFDSTISVQMSFINRRANIKDLRNSIYMPARSGKDEEIRREYRDIIKNQFAKGSNSYVKRKYITVSIEAESLPAARMRLERIETDVVSNFKTLLGVTARALTGYERLETLHGQFHPDGSENLIFDWKDIVHTGLSTKDFIAPASFDFSGGRLFRMDTDIGAVSYLQIIAPELSDKMLTEFLALDDNVTITMHIQSIDQAEAIKTVKRKLSDIDSMKISEQKKAARAGYDIDVLPSDLVTFGKEAQTLLNDLQNRNERMFLVTFLIMNTAKRPNVLDQSVFAAAGIARKYNCALKRLEYLQEQGLMSSLILGNNQTGIKRGLTTGSVAVFIPFTATELFQGGESLYYGVNAVSNNLIMANRKTLPNPNGLYLGIPGSGKSFAAKRE
ncbi:MAG: conjugal transfer protein TraE, partial [Clostridiales bacterium]|nr:conjugal transfer protein TraE [Clostridiales bacterium]